MKVAKFQSVARRAPQQGRALHKVELILEAAVRLIDKGGLDALNTNAVAALAGVSIGTLYQYFPDKGAILDELSRRHIAALSDRVLKAVQSADNAALRERVAAILRAVLASYGKRQRVHRILMEYSLSRTGGARLAILADQLIVIASGFENMGTPLSKADAFVIAHAFIGVLRAFVITGSDAIPIEEIERSLTKILQGVTAR